MKNSKTILCIETSRKQAEVELVWDDHILSQAIVAPETQATGLIPLIKSLVEESGKDFSDIESLALNIGPGSNAGLRMGLSVAQGFSAVYPKIKIHAITVESMALHCIKNNPEAKNFDKGLLLMDAYGGKVFYQKYVKKTDWLMVGEMEQMEWGRVSELNEKSLLVTPFLSEDARLEPLNLCQKTSGIFPSVQWVRSSALESEQYVEAIESIDVRYLSASSAEINWNKMNKNA